jgi:DNA repair protein RecO (recombination protein O)
LKGADIAEDFLSVRTSRRALYRAANWCKELGACLPIRYENDALLSLFWGTMKNLSCGMSPLLLDIRFAWRWGNIWGVAPSLNNCLDCGALVSTAERRDISRTAEGFVCEECASRRTRSQDGGGLLEPLASEAFDMITSAALSPAEKFVGREPSMRALHKGNRSLEGETETIASWLYSFVRTI